MCVHACSPHAHKKWSVFVLRFCMKWKGIVPKLWGMEVGFLNVVGAHPLGQAIASPACRV